MPDRKQIAIIKKDIAAITANKRMMTVLLMVPLIMTIVIPTIFIFTFHFSPVNSPDMLQMIQRMGSVFPGGVGLADGDMKSALINLVINYIMPLFFLLIPIMSSSVMAASSFVGEKEKKTLETLLYSPLPLNKIFGAKILASFFLSMSVSVISFIIMLIVVETEIVILNGSPVLPGINWLIIMLLVSPSVSLIAINLIVRGSAKAQSFEESQQRAIFLVLPVILLIVGQFTGVMLISRWLLLAIGVVLAAAALLLFRGSYGKFQYETLLQ